VFIGGEGAGSPLWFQGVDWIKNAKQFGALAFELEHRYYGSSIPDNGLTKDKLQYLSSRQALADLAEFIKAMKKEHKLTDDQKWITFGGSYAGMLSAWARLKYPDLVAGAVASSAPVFAEADFKEYLEVVGQSLTSLGSEECDKNVKSSTDTIRELLKTDDGRKTLKEKLHLCTDINYDNKLDVENLMASLAGDYQGVVQYNNEGQGVTIKDICDTLTDTSIGDVIDRYYKVHNQLHGFEPNRGDAQGQGQCFPFSYDEMIQAIRMENGDLGGMRQWFWQTCTEFGFYQTTDSENQPFGGDFDLAFALKQCADVFGDEFTPDKINKAIDDTNEFYGGRNLKTTNVIVINGSIDPWHALGILEDEPGVPSAYVTGTAHCADMLGARSNDPAELTAAREKITASIEEWLKK